MLTKYISIGGYSREVRAFVTLIKSTVVNHTPKTIVYLEIWDNIPKQDSR